MRAKSGLIIALLLSGGFIGLTGASQEAAAVENGTSETAPPWAVRLSRPDGRTVCTGALIERSWVITAAHCAKNDIALATIGSTFTTTAIDGFTRELDDPTRRLIHPNWFENCAVGETDPCSFDVMLLPLESPAPEHWEVLPLPPQSIQFSTGDGVTFFGYGQIGNGVDADRIYKTNDGDFYYGDKCRDEPEMSELACLIPAGQSRIRAADSGGPWTLWRDGWLLLAVQSGAGNWGSATATVSRDIAFWIERNVGLGSFSAGTILEDKDSANAWLVGSDGFRYWIPSDEDYLCFEAQGYDVQPPLSLSVISQTPDRLHHHATCESTDPPDQADSGVPPNLPSNEQWIARNHRGENGLDFNGDGESDIFAANGSNWKVKYSGTGGWVVLNTSVTTMDTLAFGDFDCDGITDVFNANGSIWRVSYGATENWETINTSGVTTDRLAIVDADGDGCSDVFKTNGTNWNVSWNGTSTWKTIATSGVTLDNLIFADMNADGETDAFRTNGSEWFVAHSLTAPWVKLNNSGAPSSILAVGNFGWGGKDDVFRANGNSWRVSPSGTGGWSTLASSGIGLDRMIFGDFDGNGKTDIFRISGNKWKVAYDGKGPWVTIGTSSASLERLAG